MDVRAQHPDQENEMLHCKPSQIQLTPADVNELEQRMSYRRRAFSDAAKGKARLSTGPRLPTIIAAAHAEDGIAAQHASTTTPLSPLRPSEETTKRPRYAIPTREASALVLRPHLRHTSQSVPAPDAEPVKVDSPGTSPSPPPRLNLPKLDIPWDTSLRHRRRQTSPSHHAIAPYDGADDPGDAHFLRPQPTSTHSVPLHAGREVFRELPGAATVPSPPHTSPRRSPGGRARRSKLRNYEGNTHLQVDSAAHLPARDTSSGGGHPQQSREESTAHIRQDLDPGAQVFTPRVRFGSTTIVPDAESASPEITDTDTSTLRVRTLSEQNASPNTERRPQATTPSRETRPRRLRSNAIVSRSRRSSENIALPLPNLERYPLILPNTRSAFERDRREPSIAEIPPPQIAALQLPSEDQPADVSSATETPPSRIPSIVSAASGISSLSISEDAATEFLRFRSSPLDGLTAELSRLSTALGPAAKSTENRVSLLNGSPFDSNNAIIQDELPGPQPTTEIHALSRDVVTSRLLASPSRLTLPSSPPQPSTSIPQTTASPAQLESPQCHSTIRLVNTTAAPNPTTPAAPAPTTATPKLPVYNDATPARLQPQTPADIARTSRRTRNRSDSSVHREAFCVGQVLVAQRPTVPERRAYRNTYPTNAPAGTVMPVVGDARLRQLNASTDDGTENDTEGQLAGLESERAVWMRRRQGGSLDVTPPGHGRFERFLH